LIHLRLVGAHAAGVSDGAAEVGAMHIPGQRVKRTRLIQTKRYVVAVAVEMVIPADDASEPCYEFETVQFLREVRERAERGDCCRLAESGRPCGDLTYRG
jgi:hypothetical protein